MTKAFALIGVSTVALGSTGAIGFRSHSERGRARCSRSATSRSTAVAFGRDVWIANPSRRRLELLVPPGAVEAETRDSERTAMNVVWGFLIVAAVTAVGVTALLLVRRRAPEGGFFEDGDRAAGVFGVLATGFSVLLGFIVFLAFESYDQSRSGA